MINNLFPVTRRPRPTRPPAGWDEAAEPIRRENGFDPVQHEQLREDLQRGRIGLARNRLPVDIDIRDVDDSDLIRRRRPDPRPTRSGAGEAAIRRGEVAVVSLAAGVGSRWTTGAGVVKAVNPFVDARRPAPELPRDPPGQDRARPSGSSASTIPHVVTTSYLTHARHRAPPGADRQLRPRRPGLPLARPVDRPAADPDGPRPDLPLGRRRRTRRSTRTSRRSARPAAARSSTGPRSQGEGTDYTDNVPIQRFNPPGPLLRGAQPAPQRRARPAARRATPTSAGCWSTTSTPWARTSTRACSAWRSRPAPTLGFEVIPRRIDDRGGGLARVGGRLRLLEGLAQPREDTEFAAPLLQHPDDLGRHRRPARRPSG